MVRNPIFVTQIINQFYYEKKMINKQVIKIITNYLLKELLIGDMRLEKISQLKLKASSNSNVNYVIMLGQVEITILQPPCKGNKKTKNKEILYF